MDFKSIYFVFFFIIVLTFFYLTPGNFKKYTLLAFSWFFYAYINPMFLLLLVAVSFSTFIFAKKIDEINNDINKRNLFYVAILFVLFPLIFLKYFNPINYIFGSLVKSIGLNIQPLNLQILVPVGISFYTLMAVGYLIDVYNEKISAEKNFTKLALFVSFFPLILSGPIERAERILPQLGQLKKFNFVNIEQGLKAMLWGFFLKLVVADRIGLYVDSVYANFQLHNGTTLIFTTLLYPFQMYADLAGYSLIAIGVAKALGIEVMSNFKRPFFATTMSGFWRRWHISLISWLTDYVFIPLNFSLRSYKTWGIITALFITFIISGLWHEAKMTFLIWGSIQGFILSVEAVTNVRRQFFEKRYNLVRKKWYFFSGIVVTYFIFAFSLVFSRSESVNQAIYIIKSAIKPIGKLFIGTPSTFVYIIFGVLIVLIKDYLDEFGANKYLLFVRKNMLLRQFSYAIIVVIILLFGVFDGGQFIYFQF
jgi:D-alanyl-lipoteichoic acid acyltransferase DltB (MBOAT superfamily)